MALCHNKSTKTERRRYVTAEEIITLYRRRWDIEVFFKMCRHFILPPKRRRKPGPSKADEEIQTNKSSLNVHAAISLDYL